MDRWAAALKVVALASVMWAGAWMWWNEPRRKARRAIARQRRQPLEELRDGDRAHVSGVVERLAETVVSPISRRACVGFSIVVEENLSRSTYANESRWSAILMRTICVPFRLLDGMAEAVVEGPFELGLDLDDRGDVWANLPPTVYRLLDEAGVSYAGSALRFTEALLLPGDRVELLASVSIQPDPTGNRRALRSPPMRIVMRGTAGDPVVITDADDEMAYA